MGLKHIAESTRSSFYRWGWLMPALFPLAQVFGRGAFNTLSILYFLWALASLRSLPHEESGPRFHRWFIALYGLMLAIWALSLTQAVDPQKGGYDLLRYVQYSLTGLCTLMALHQYHHTISSPLVYALHAALGEVLDEGLEARWARHKAAHDALVAGLSQIGLELFPDPAHCLYSLNAVRIPPGVDEKAVRAQLRSRHHIEIGAGLGPLAGRIWRIGLMGSGATVDNVQRVVSALADALGRKRPR